MRQFNTLTGFLLSKSSTPTTSDQVEFLGYAVIGDGGGSIWQHNGITGQTVSQSPVQLDDALLNDASGNQWAMVGDARYTFDTFANFELSAIGNIGQRFTVLDKKSDYITQPSTYSKLAGDATLASGLVASSVSERRQGIKVTRSDNSKHYGWGSTAILPSGRWMQIYRSGSTHATGKKAASKGTNGSATLTIRIPAP